MAIEVVCHVCQRKMAAPDELAGREGTCPWCKSVVSIPVPGLVPIDYSLPSLPSEQWYVTLPDGSQLGPATEEQFQGAQARGVLPPTALVRRGDWPQPMQFGDWQSRLNEQARQQAEAKRLPYGTYSQQFSNNPVGTLLFGPQMPKHQANRDPQVRASRRRHFNVWLGILGAYFLGAMIFPALAASALGDPKLAIGALVAGVFWVLGPTAFYLIGMLMYSGALFEWSWFFNSRRMRSMRAAGGDGYARGFYLWVGGILMGGSAAVAFGGVFLVTLAMALSGAQKGQRGQPLAAQPVVPRPIAQQPIAPQPGIPQPVAVRPVVPQPPPRSQRVVQASWEVDRARNALDNAGRSLMSQLDRVERTQKNLGLDPQHVTPRVTAASDDVNALRAATEFEIKRAAWQKACENLVAVQKSEKETPAVIAPEKKLAPHYTAILAAIEERSKNPFPHQEVANLEREIQSLDIQFRGFLQTVARGGGKQIMSASYGSPPQLRTGSAEEFLHELAALMQPKVDRLAAIEAQWKFRSRFLPVETFQQRIDAALAGKAPGVLPPPTRLPIASAPPPPTNNSNSLDPSQFQLELQFKIRRTFYLSRQKTYAQDKERLEKAKQDPTTSTIRIKIYEDGLQRSQERLNEERTEMLARRAALEEFCQREGKKSALLDEPIPE